MKSRKELRSGLTGTLDRFFDLLHKEKPGFLQSGRDHEQMHRVTDYAGNEFLCPITELKDPDFVGESEKANCFDYNVVSKTLIG